MWWEWVVGGYVVLWGAGTLFLGVVLFWHTLKHGVTPLAEMFLPLAVLFWFGCWRAFLFHRWAVIAVCIFGWLLTLLLSAHTTLPSAWDDPKIRDLSIMSCSITLWLSGCFSSTGFQLACLALHLSLDGNSGQGDFDSR